MQAIRAGRAFDGTDVVPGGALVLIDDGRIVGVEAGSAEVPDGWPVASFPDATVLPGLIDTHVHLCGDSQRGALDRLVDYSDTELEAIIEDSLQRQLAAGVTTVRDLGDRRWVVLDWRERVAAGRVAFPCPTIVASGPPITCQRGHCWYMGGETEGAEQLRAAVGERAERRVDVVKVMASGGALTPGTNMMTPQFTFDELRLLVEESHSYGLGITAHAHGLPAVHQAIDAGVDGIEHCSCLTETKVDVSDQLLAKLAASGVSVCPTMGQTADAVPPPHIKAMLERIGMTHEGRQQIVGRMYRAGVSLVSGADSGISDGKPHGVLPAGIADFVAGGIPPADALASATSVAAEKCGLGPRKGRLRAGYDADVLIVAGDPLADISALERVRAVYVGGVLAS